MSLMETFSNPETMHSLSFGEKMAASTITMLMGLGITFLILAILWAFIVLMGKVMGLVEGGRIAAPKRQPAAPTRAAKAAATDDDEISAVLAAAVKAYENDDAIAAVIAAAVAAYEADVGIPNNLVVRKIVRIPSGTTLWMDAARDDVIASRRF